MRETALVPCLTLILQLSAYAATTSAYHHRHSTDQMTPLTSYQNQNQNWYQTSRQHAYKSGKVARSVPHEQKCPIRNEFDVKAAGMLCVKDVLLTKTAPTTGSCVFVTGCVASPVSDLRKNVLNFQTPRMGRSRWVDDISRSVNWQSDII